MAMLSSREAHVWTVHVDAMPPLPAHASACLSEAERERAGRIVDVVSRERFLRSRIVLRALLTSCTGTAPGALALGRTPRGKPLLLGHAGHFSISHSRGLLAIAVADVAAGIDVEHVRPLRHLDRVARRILHPQTATLLARLDEQARAATFIDAWTLREAHVKAVGGGLFQTPDVLPFAPDAAPADGVLRDVAARDGSAWGTARFAPAAGVRGAVVLQGTGRRLTLHDTEHTLHMIVEAFDDRA